MADIIDQQAYYNPAGNEIVFPAGIMQSPVFYSPQVPQYLSYGAFGSVSGHELSHGKAGFSPSQAIGSQLKWVAFDSTGCHYDETGNFTDWWDESTVQAFEDKVQCFVDQYHKFTVPGLDGKPLHVNGRLTLGENIADAGGLSASFQAWKRREAQEATQSLPGLQHFSKEQLFFISYSNWWCGKIRKEAAVDAIYRDPHSPKWARILVSEVFSYFPMKKARLGLGLNGDMQTGHDGEFSRVSGELWLPGEGANMRAVVTRRSLFLYLLGRDWFGWHWVDRSDLYVRSRFAKARASSGV